MTVKRYKAKPCLRCAASFLPNSAASKYCPSCAPVMAREGDHRRHARYQARHPERCKARAARYRRDHPQRIRHTRRKFHDAHPDYKHDEYMRHRTGRLASAKRWQQENRDQRRVIQRRYYQGHRSQVFNHSHARRARLRGAKIDNRGATKFLVQLRAALSAHCYWCEKLVPKGARELDHITPLARGGTHEPANLCCSCKACNRSKGTRMPEDFCHQYELKLTG